MRPVYGNNWTWYCGDICLSTEWCQRYDSHLHASIWLCSENFLGSIYMDSSFGLSLRPPRTYHGLKGTPQISSKVHPRRLNRYTPDVFNQQINYTLRVGRLSKNKSSILWSSSIWLSPFCHSLINCGYTVGTRSPTVARRPLTVREYKVLTQEGLSQFLGTRC